MFAEGKSFVVVSFYVLKYIKWQYNDQNTGCQKKQNLTLKAPPFLGL